VATIAYLGIYQDHGQESEREFCLMIKAPPLSCPADRSENYQIITFIDPARDKSTILVRHIRMTSKNVIKSAEPIAAQLLFGSVHKRRPH